MRIFDIEDAANGLLLEPLPRVALVDACSISKLGSRQRTTVCERLVETQPVADVDA